VGLAVVAGPGAGVAQDDEPPPTKPTHLRVGRGAPSFSFIGLDGKEVTLADFRGRYVLIDFVWWTAGNFAIQSKGEIPALREVQQRFYGKRFAIIAISMDRDPEAVRAVMATEKLSFPVYVHKTGFEGEICTLYGVQRCPANFLVSKTGRIIRIDLPSVEFVDVVGELLAKEPPDPEIPAAYNLLKQGSVEAAIVKARRAVRDDPYNARTHTLLADCYYAAQNLRGAMGAYLAADERLDKYEPPGLIVYVCNRVAGLWHGAGKPDKAAAALERGLELIEDPRYRLQLLYDVGGLYMKLGQFELAAERLLEFVSAYGKASEEVRNHYLAKGKDVERRLVRIRKALIAARQKREAEEEKHE
jgi:peroxiredoxin/Tfp pilus assembly protein PilF